MLQRGEVRRGASNMAVALNVALPLTAIGRCTQRSIDGATDARHHAALAAAASRSPAASAAATPLAAAATLFADTPIDAAVSPSTDTANLFTAADALFPAILLIAAAATIPF